ncbi:hypothetical protein [Haloarcula onubensis]|uniref:Uncharacterized protein n=1 Tax=Haloarcula onubensis TaxID=2950539 RepID=A0ABU2FLY9_9EURY|nr:hypothetical protein [Halomicroarcula sp. S3CR25-11]MDS0281419.1 hypothetical protein [Halomicroarcula sp. S3CR25-11]
MPEITVTESQRERLAAIEGELDAAYIDTYGCIRTKDVVQYLLDTYTPPEERGADAAYDRLATADFQALQAVAADVEGVPGSGIDAETMRGELLSALGAAEFAARLADADDDVAQAPADAGETTPDGDAAGESDADDASADDDDTESDADDDASDETGSQSGSTPGGDGPGAILSAANQLLDDHDDKWRDGGSDEPYEVDLPDGTTKKVRTKDDIRGLLFKHY